MSRFGMQNHNTKRKKMCKAAKHKTITKNGYVMKCNENEVRNTFSLHSSSHFSLYELMTKCGGNCLIGCFSGVGKCFFYLSLFFTVCHENVFF